VSSLSVQLPGVSTYSISGSHAGTGAGVDVATLNLPQIKAGQTVLMDYTTTRTGAGTAVGTFMGYNGFVNYGSTFVKGSCAIVKRTTSDPDCFIVRSIANTTVVTQTTDLWAGATANILNLNVQAGTTLDYRFTITVLG